MLEQENEGQIRVLQCPVAGLCLSCHVLATNPESISRSREMIILEKSVIDKGKETD